MRLVTLTRWDGVPIHVNPARILYVEPRPERGPEGGCRGSVLVFDQHWHPDLADGRAVEHVRETPTEVAGLCVSPLGRDAA